MGEFCAKTAFQIHFHGNSKKVLFIEYFLILNISLQIFVFQENRKNKNAKEYGPKSNDFTIERIDRIKQLFKLTE